MQILKEEIRKKILNSAIEEFIEKGYDHASMRTIAKNAGITAGNIYRYFDSKEKLLVDIVNPVLEKVNLFMNDITNNELSFNMLPNNNIFLSDREKALSLPLISSFSSFIIKLFKVYKNEIIILLTNKEVLSKQEKSIDFDKWLLELFKVNYSLVNNNKEINEEEKIFLKAIENSFVMGLVDIARNCDDFIDSPKILEKYIKFFFDI